MEKSEAWVFLKSVGSTVNTPFPLIKALNTSFYSHLRSWSPGFAVARRRAKTTPYQSNWRPPSCGEAHDIGTEERRERHFKLVDCLAS